jgi:hypothetical protein
MEELLPALQGMPAQGKTLNAVTGRSNDTSLGAVDEPVQAHESGRQSSLDSSWLEAGRRRILCDVLAERDAFVHRYRANLSAALGDNRLLAGNQPPRHGPALT